MSLGDDLKAELKRKIENDMSPLGKWNASLWMKITFGDYYGKSALQLVTIHRVVGGCVNKVLARIEPGFQMSVDSWAGLQSAIDAADTAETALPDMEDAAMNSEPLGAEGSKMAAAKPGSSKAAKKKKKTT